MEVDRFSDTDPYRQVAEQLRDAIVAGEITVRLPSARDISQDAGVAMFTATKALRLLRQWGYARVTKGTGTYVAPREDWPGDDRG